ncbi:hypothetical protein yfred0001_39690 [Yersinia frederiksenii ATCC 33641]|nr:hypothetical protein yfred0001_39690 [Yersinia frederiksenii ATCC 33641]
MPVLIAGTAIIATRFIGVVLLVAELGWSGTGSFIDESLQTWGSGFVFTASVLLLLLEIVCGVAVCLRQNWARWSYLLCQLLVIVYLLMVSLDWLSLDVDVFRVEGDTGAEILHSLLLQKIPDVVIIGLLFFPWHRYFRASK